MVEAVGDPLRIEHYSQIFRRWVEFNATLPTCKLELLTLELHPPTRSWESMNPQAGIGKFLRKNGIILQPEAENVS
jgi:hypothetical protein